MTGVTDAGSTRALIAGPTVLRTFAFALVGRLAYGVLPLCFLFTVRDATGSFPAAAAASAAFGLATLAMPVQARLVDRHGQRRVLPVYAAAFSALLCIGAVLAACVQAPAAWVGLGLLLGLTSPALGPAMRAQWREIAPEGPLRRRAYSIDSVAEELLYLLGPVLAGVVLATGPAWVGLLVAVALVTCGAAALACSRYRPPVSDVPAQEQTEARATYPKGLRSQPQVLAGTVASFGAGGAAVFVGVAAAADRAGSPQAAASVEAAMAGGAVVGGLLWARYGGGQTSLRTLAMLLGYLALAQVATAAVVGNLALGGAVLAAGALATSPIFVVAFSAADGLVPEQRRTEASTWVTVSANGGIAMGTAVGGVVAGHASWAPFALGAVMTGGAAAAAFRVLRPDRT